MCKPQVRGPGLAVWNRPAGHWTNTALNLPSTWHLLCALVLHPHRDSALHILWGAPWRHGWRVDTQQAPPPRVARSAGECGADPGPATGPSHWSTFPPWMCLLRALLLPQMKGSRGCQPRGARVSASQHYKTRKGQMFGSLNLPISFLPMGSVARL